MTLTPQTEELFVVLLQFVLLKEQLNIKHLNSEEGSSMFKVKAKITINEEEN